MLGEWTDTSIFQGSVANNDWGQGGLSGFEFMHENIRSTVSNHPRPRSDDESRVICKGSDGFFEGSN